MKPFLALFILLFAVLQYELWIAPGGLASAWNLHTAIDHLQARNQKLVEKNGILAADIEDLKHGNEAVEEHARNDLGMVKPGEVFYQVVSSSGAAQR